MSAYRVPGPDGRIVLIPADDGATPYMRRSNIGGSLAVSVSTPRKLDPDAAERAAAQQRAWYERNKALVMERQRQARAARR